MGKTSFYASSASEQPEEVEFKIADENKKYAALERTNKALEKELDEAQDEISRLSAEISEMKRKQRARKTFRKPHISEGFKKAFSIALLTIMAIVVTVAVVSFIVGYNSVPTSELSRTSNLIAFGQKMDAGFSRIASVFSAPFIEMAK